MSGGQDGSVARVSALNVAPVKGLGLTPREWIRIDRDGVPEDRRVLLLHGDGSVVTLRRSPALGSVVPDLDLEAGRIAVHLPDGTVAGSSLSDVTEPVESVLFGKRRAGRLLPGDVADALSHVAGEPLRVVLADDVGFGWDEGPVSLISRASAEAVGTPDGDLRRYRMLIGLDDCAAFDEDGWAGSLIEVGDAVLRVSHPMRRCLVIEQHPGTGERDWRGLRELAVRRGRDRVTLGMIAHVEQAGVVRLGDELTPA